MFAFLKRTIVVLLGFLLVAFLIWCPLTILLRGPAQIPPFPTIENLNFSDEGLGWFKGTRGSGKGGPGHDSPTAT